MCTEKLNPHVVDAIAIVTGANPQTIVHAKNLYLDLDIDSLTAGQIVLEIERRIGVWIPLERMPELDTAAKMSAAVSQYVD